MLARLEDDDDREAGRPESRDSRQRSLVQMYVVVRGLAAAAVDAALAEARFLLSTGGSRSRGRISPSNGNVSHSSTGGIRRESLTRS